MTLELLTALFGWMTVINVALLVSSTIILLLFRNQVISIHSKLTGVKADSLISAYLYFLVFYKVLIIVFNIIPYLALKLL